VLNPPVIACLVATALGLGRSPLVDLLATYELGPTIWPLLDPFRVALEYTGRCTVPVTLMALGARLDEALTELRGGGSGAGEKSVGDPQLQPPAVEPELVGLAVPETEAKEAESTPTPGSDSLSVRQDSGAPVPHMPLSAYAAVLLLRQLVGPLLGAAVALGLLRGLCGITDREVLMVAMLQSAGPPMINLSVMAGLSG
ncbi:unnamed protein product, partial [Polarella glacialis]